MQEAFLAEAFTGGSACTQFELVSSCVKLFPGDKSERVSFVLEMNHRKIRDSLYKHYSGHFVFVSRTAVCQQYNEKVKNIT